MVVDIHDVITAADFGEDRLRGLGVACECVIITLYPIQPLGYSTNEPNFDAISSQMIKQSHHPSFLPCPYIPQGDR